MASARTEILTGLIRVGILCLGTYISARLMMKMLDPNREGKEEAKKKAEEIMRLIDLPEPVELNEYELRIAAMLVPPDDGVDWNEIAGYENLIKELHKRLVLPFRLMKDNHLSSKGSLMSPAKGILLYGPPGCGKTLIARALAKSVNARFINLDISVLTDKWYGESQKMVAALFSFARKVEPTIIFIDEIDAFLRDRQLTDNETTAIIKAQFMTLWDGFANSDSKVVILGATNHMGGIDSAIFRRLPARFAVPLPDSETRTKILKHVLRHENCKEIDYNKLSEITENLSGSDLKEICRTAALRCLSHAYDSDNDSLDPDMSITEKDLVLAALNFRGVFANSENPYADFSVD